MTASERTSRSGLTVIRRIVRLAVRSTAAASALCLVLIAIGAVTGRWGLVPVLTGSMRPHVQPGDMVLVAPESLSAVRTGQVVVFQPPGEGGDTVVHRVIGVTRSPAGTTIRTRGDANNVADPWKVTLTGPKAFRVLGVIPKAGWVAVLESRPIGHMIIEMALLGGGISMAMSVIWGRRRRDSSEDEGAPAGLASLG
jgi:signal peptidase